MKSFRRRSITLSATADVLVARLSGDRYRPSFRTLKSVLGGGGVRVLKGYYTEKQHKSEASIREPQGKTRGVSSMPRWVSCLFGILSIWRLSHGLGSPCGGVDVVFTTLSLLSLFFTTGRPWCSIFRFFTIGYCSMYTGLYTCVCDSS